jgi:AcrR family transcriptional regulator
VYDYIEMSDQTRSYRKRERARQEAETRRRITEAVVDLHRTVGPAQTTVTEVAKRAGVGRMTVYNHFPTDAELIEACSTHWSLQNPLPDPAAWAEVKDPDERLARALEDLYRWYGGTEDMMGKVLRDAPIVPALGELMEERWWALVDQMCEVLMKGRHLRGRRGRRAQAAVRVALDFSTWRTLMGQGLSGGDAARLAAGFVGAALE